MLIRWQWARSSGPTRAFVTSSPAHQQQQRSPTPRQLSALKTESDHALARRWLDGFTVNDIPKSACDVGYSRSSGPGGQAWQHVNKTNSKATVRCDLRGHWVPPFLLAPLTRSPYYLPNPPSLLVSSQLTRTASSNLSSALEILHRTIVQAGRSVIMGETTAEQKDRVKSLIKAEKARTRGEKEKRSSKKASRKDFL